MKPHKQDPYSSSAAIPFLGVFPAVRMGGEVIHFPLTDHAAWWCLHLLAGGTSSDSPRDSATPQHISTLLLDPAFLLWLFSVDQRRESCRTFYDLAQSIEATELLAQLDWRETPREVADPGHAIRLAWKQLASTCFWDTLRFESEIGRVVRSEETFQAYVTRARLGAQTLIDLPEVRWHAIHGAHSGVPLPSFPIAVNCDSSDNKLSFLAEEEGLPEAWLQRLDRAWACDSGGGARLAEVAARFRGFKAMEQRFDAALQEAKLAAVRDLAYGASHEINNPLANIASRAQSLLATEVHPDRQRQLRAIWQQSLRAYDMLADLMLIGKPPRPERQIYNALSLMEGLVAWGRKEIAERRNDIVLETAWSSEPNTADRHAIQLWVDPTQWHAALVALLKNAFEALGHAGTVTLDFGRNQGGALDSVWFTVADSGMGLSLSAFRSALNPFFSGREAGRGLGFGLSKAWRIATDHDGWLELDLTYNQGCRVQIDFPVGGRGHDQPALNDA